MTIRFGGLALYELWNLHSTAAQGPSKNVPPGIVTLFRQALEIAEETRGNKVSTVLTEDGQAFLSLTGTEKDRFETALNKADGSWKTVRAELTQQAQKAQNSGSIVFTQPNAQQYRCERICFPNPRGTQEIGSTFDIPPLTAFKTTVLKD